MSVGVGPGASTHRAPSAYEFECSGPGPHGDNDQGRYWLWSPPDPLEQHLADRFHDELLHLYDAICAACPKYRPTRFKQLVVTDGGREAAKILLRAPNAASGFTELYLCGHLELSLEALVLTEPWKRLFTEAELNEARKRLDKVVQSN